MTNKEYIQAETSSNRDKWLMADGWAVTNGIKRQSANYSIQILNTLIIGTDEIVLNVDIGDSLLNRNASNFNQVSNISITSTISGVTYMEFLAQSENQPFTVCKTMVISRSAGQLEHSIAVTQRNSAGDRQDHVITPTLDPYQTQTDRIIDDYEYLFDGMTRLRLSSINPNATVTIKMFLKSKFSASQIVSGHNEKQEYSEPNIIKVIK